MTRSNNLVRCAVAMAVCGPIMLGGFAGCGTPGAPQPPSLNLPDRVTDLKAVRTGGRVTLTWTMPRRNTDKLLLKGNVAVHVCRRENADSCVHAGDLSLAPASEATFSESLPPALASGSPRSLGYFVELTNRRGRSAGLSNEATVPAGQAPPTVVGLGAEVRKAGIVLRWNDADPRDAIRLERKLVTSPNQGPATARREGPLAAPREPTVQNLLVATDAGMALDPNIHFGETYEYRAQRIAFVRHDENELELAGDWSPPLRIQPLDVFPPARPAGLAAVATAATAEAPAAIDLSWQPDTEPDLAGYYVYRREAETPWRRISGDKAIAGPAFHDAQVLAGHSYIYGVSAVDAKGNESQRSEDAEETVPSQ